MKCLKFYEKKLGMSDWLSVLETMRRNDYLGKHIPYAKTMFRSSYDPDIFSTDGYGNFET